MPEILEARTYMHLRKNSQIISISYGLSVLGALPQRNVTKNLYVRSISIINLCPIKIHYSQMITVDKMVKISLYELIVYIKTHDSEL